MITKRTWGTKNLVDAHSQEISDIQVEVARQKGFLDSINSAFKVIGLGNVTLTYSGGAYNTGTANAGTGTATYTTFLAYFVRADRPTQLYQIPYYEYDGSGNMIFSVTGNTQSGSLSFNGFTSGSTPNITISWYALSQPAGVQAT